MGKGDMELSKKRWVVWPFFIGCWDLGGPRQWCTREEQIISLFGELFLFILASFSRPLIHMHILLYFYKFQLYEDNWIKSKTINYNILFCGKTHRQPFLHTNIRITNTIIIKFTSVPIALKNNNNNKNFNKIFNCIFLGYLRLKFTFY